MLSGTRDNLDTDRYNAYIDFLVFYIKDYYLISKNHISYQDWNQVNQPTSEYMFPTMASKLQHSPLELEISECFILIWQNQIKLRFKQ